MKVRIGSLFSEPGYRFNVSYKVIQYLEKVVDGKIFKKNNIKLKNEETFLSIYISTSSKTIKAEARGPDYDKRNNCDTWALWLPYSDIVNAEDYLAAYYDNFFIAVKQLFNYYNVSDDDIEEAQKDARSEIMNNPIYRQIDDESEPLDLSKL